MQVHKAVFGWGRLRGRIVCGVCGMDCVCEQVKGFGCIKDVYGKWLSWKTTWRDV